MRMRQLCLLGGLLLVAACQDELPTATAPEPEPSLAVGQNQEPVRVILQVGGGGPPSTIASQLEARGARVLRQIEAFNILVIEVSPNALAGLSRVPGVIGVQQDVPEPPALDASIPLINADDVHALGRDGTGLAVAILDTGIEAGHAFFGGRVVEEACFSSDNGSDELTLCPNGTTSQTGAGAAAINIANCMDGGNNICDHGTHVAGIAAGDGTGLGGGAPATGVAPGAEIIAVQVFTRFTDATDCAPNAAPCVLTYPSDQIAGLAYVLGLAGSYDIAAANMSLGGGSNAAACDGDSRKPAIDALVGADIATAIAAGNNGFLAAVGAPGCISTAVTVGATDNADNIAGFSNRGTLLDLFAPGNNIFSSVDGGNFGFKSGTSMATPHVAGAWAVLRQELPGASVAQILTLLQDTGVDITDGNGVTRSRIDLFAAYQATGDPPVIAVDDATVTVDEGQTAQNSGTVSDPDDDITSITASIGTVVDNGDGTWDWSFDTSDGPAESQTVTVTVTDAKLLEDQVDFELVVENVDPTVTIDPAQVTAIDEGDALAVTAHFTDPGVLDEPYTASIECYDVAGGLVVAGDVEVTDDASPDLAGTVTGECTYGDTSQSGEPPSGSFTVTVTVTDKDGGEGSAAFDVDVANVDPTVALDPTGSMLIDGSKTFIAQIGDELDFETDVTDPGSDDLSLLWDWDDGLTDAAQYLLNPPGTDPFPSPDVDPRDITDAQSHSWTDACLYLMTITATDDDGGEGSDDATIIIAGNSGMARGSGYWLVNYRQNKPMFFTAATLTCYLEITEHLSSVFDEVTDGTSSRQAAADVLFVNQNNGTMEELFDEQLLAAWLNFANGAFTYDELVDTDFDQVPDTAFSDVIAAAEAVRLDAGATASELEEQKNILESVNLMHGG